MLLRWEWRRWECPQCRKVENITLDKEISGNDHNVAKCIYKQSGEELSEPGEGGQPCWISFCCPVVSSPQIVK